MRFKTKLRYCLTGSTRPLSRKDTVAMVICYIALPAAAILVLLLVGTGSGQGWWSP